MNSSDPSIDIFCQVIDNYGDIGVCWRLAQQLKPYSSKVRLFVDDLKSFTKIEPQVNPLCCVQDVSGILIHTWSLGHDLDVTPAQLVIEAFSCTLPDRYIHAMSEHTLCWINVDYLSAEDWVHSVHLLPSVQANKVPKYFFYPGFTLQTGGLLREPDLLDRLQAFQQDKQAQTDFLTPYLSANNLHAWQAGSPLIYIFCYPHAPVQALLSALDTLPVKPLICVPEGVLPTLEEQMADHGFFFQRLPFVPQAQFDYFLALSTLSFIRGEDSFIRAHWTGQPFVWHIYPQTEATHLEKLEAWLDRTPFDETVKRLQRAWNTGDETQVLEALTYLLEPTHYKVWHIQTQQWQATLAQQTDLAQQLIEFYKKLQI